MMLSKRRGTLQTKHCDHGSCAIIRRRYGPELVYRDANVLMALVLILMEMPMRRMAFAMPFAKQKFRERL